MGFRSIIKNSILRCDLFSCSTHLRYKGQANYETIFGGIISILISIAFLIITINSFVVLAQKITINSVSEQKEQINTVEKFTDLYFTIGIQGVDLNGAQRYFDVVLGNLKHQNYSIQPTVRTPIELKPCNISDWSHLDPQFTRLYTIYNMNYNLCPKQGQNFQILGHETASVYEYLQIRIQQCTNGSSTTDCATNAEISKFISNQQNTKDYFKVKFFIVNNIISPQAPNPIRLILEKDIFLTFGTNIGAKGTIGIGTFQIDTDQSILPYAQITTNTGHFIAKHQTHAIQLKSTHYAKLKIQKSPHLVQITRNHGKVDDTLSYIGGLFGLLFSFLAFFISTYSQASYQMSIASYAFKTEDQQNINSFNFWTYVKYQVWTYLKIFNLNCRCQNMQKIDEIKNQATAQIDIRLIVRQLNYYKNLSDVLLKQHQRSILYAANSPTYQQSQQYRQNLGIVDDEQQNQTLKDMENSNQIQKIQQDYRNGNKVSPIAMQSSQIQSYIGSPTNIKTFERMPKFRSKFTESYEKLLKQKQNEINKRIFEKVDLQRIYQLTSKRIFINIDRKQQKE